MSRRARTTRRSVAFTLIELMGVVVVILVLVIITLPAVGRIIESANYAAAVNLVTATLGNARAIAMQQGQYTGVAFLYDVREEQYTLQVIQLSTNRASLTNRPTGDPRGANAIAFRPAINTTPVELPRGTGVYGLSFFIASEDADTIDDIGHGTYQWYAGEIIREGTVNQVIPWIFPRNDPRLFLPAGVDPWFNNMGELDIINNNDKITAVRHADSFCIVFDPEGSVVASLAIGFRSDIENAYIELPDQPVADDNDSRVVYDDPARFDPEARPSQGLEGGSPNPEVKLRTVSQLAVVDFPRMISETGVRDPWLLRASSSRANTYRPAYTDGGVAVAETRLDELVERVSDWIDANAQIIGFNRYTGAAIKR